MSHITINVETIGDPSLPAALLPSPDDYDAPGNYKDSVKIMEYKENAARSEMGRMGLFPLTGRIICGSYLYADSDGKVDEIRTIHGDNEREIVQGLINGITQVSAEFPTLVTYNGISFDVPYICTAAARYGIPLPTGYEYKDLLNKYGSDHIDVYTYLTAFGINKKGKLSDWSLRFGFEPPYGSGDMVSSWFKLGDWDSITRHCSSNVRCTDQLFNALKQANFFGALRG